MLTTDPAVAAGLVTREVRTSTRDGQPTRVAVARRSYDTDAADLWDALTNPERLPRWFLPVTGDLSVGGRYQVEGNANGFVEACDPPRSLSVTWENGPMVSWLTVSLASNGDGTVLELVHEAPVMPQMWDQFGPGAVGVGWDLALLGLALHIDTRAPVDPAEGLAFPTSPAGVEFVTAAARSWADAAVADGDDRRLADAGAAATVTFYTVEPAPEAEPGSPT